MNLVEGMLVESGAPDAAAGDGSRTGTSTGTGTLSVAFPGASVPLPAEVANVVRGAGPDVVLGLRPESLHLSPDGAIAASVIIVELLGAETHVICHTETGARIIVRQGASSAKPALGEAVRIAVDAGPQAYHLFDAATGERLGGP
jgi:multiple sugar transport system ATP-binding protein